MKRLLLIFISTILLCNCPLLSAEQGGAKTQLKEKQPKSSAPLQCAAFSPYVGDLNPDYGAHPSKELINTLLDQLIKQTPFRCIMTYGVMNGLENIFAAAEAKHIKVISIVWLDKDIEMNSKSIAKGIEVAKAYPKTIIKMSCGSEVRTRHRSAFDGEILRCLDSLRKAGVTQPLTTIDTWWEWCNAAIPCQQTLFADKVDWIGINIFPWWENKYAGKHTCTKAEQAADFHIDRLTEVRNVYPAINDVMITEFGWPNGPDGGTEVNTQTKEHCGIASKRNQALVVQTTFKKLAEKKWSGVVFEAFTENWKPSNEGNFGRYWGICQGESPYVCAKDLLPKKK